MELSPNFDYYLLEDRIGFGRNVVSKADDILGSKLWIASVHFGEFGGQLGTLPPPLWKRTFFIDWRTNDILFWLLRNYLSTFCFSIDVKAKPVSKVVDYFIWLINFNLVMSIMSGCLTNIFFLTDGWKLGYVVKYTAVKHINVIFSCIDTFMIFVFCYFCISSILYW